MHHCPECDAELQYEEPDPDTGIIGGFFCTECDWVDEDSSFSPENDEADYADAERKIKNGS